MADTAAAPTVDDIRKESEKRGIDFYFAQFVDMYARPSAKLVPAANLDDLVSDGAGFAGFAAGEIGQFPSDPDIAAIPDLASFTPVPVGADGGTLRLRHPCRRRRVGLLTRARFSGARSRRPARRASTSAWGSSSSTSSSS